ncbi:pentapeptide repeat-containing protein [bacterium]|nr:pentapeptide repeat-containing protein [bacterium]
MRTKSRKKEEKPCQYEDCPHPAEQFHEFCRWHTALVDKSQDDTVKGQLEEMVRQRQSLQGFRLCQARLDGANLMGANLEDAILIGAHLEQANLSGARLDNSDLSTAHLQEAYLLGASLSDANLIGARLEGADLSGAKLHNTRLFKTKLFNTHLDPKSLEGTLPPKGGRGRQIFRHLWHETLLCKHTIEEKERDFHYARHIYRMLKNNARSLGDNEDVGWAYFREKQNERRAYLCWLRCYHQALREQSGWQKWGKVVGLGAKYIVKYVSSTFFNILYGYGERPWRIAGWGLVVLLFAAFLFTAFDLTVVESDALPVSTWDRFCSNLYFSVVTFTTLGYGDYTKPGWGRLIAGLESSLGILCVVFFSIAMAKRSSDR